MRNITIRYTSAVTLAIAFATIPLPTIDDNPTGLALTYDYLASKHVGVMERWVTNLNSVAYDRDKNERAEHTIDMNIVGHKMSKPKKYEYDTDVEFLNDAQQWREDLREMKKKKEKLKEDRSDLMIYKGQLLAASPQKSFLFQR
jgi:hypothetical protein